MNPATTKPTPTTHRARSTNHRQLNDRHTHKIRDQLTERAVACPHCRSQDFTIGDALEMGSIWPNEELHTYMIALTCQHCGTRNGIRLHKTQFLTG
jgi:DNA-directed RNA polymerase subunit RPC12/RpoP